ncbi:hypothetical protein ACHAWF_001385 [Thalassiosira exigua]
MRRQSSMYGGKAMVPASGASIYCRTLMMLDLIRASLACVTRSVQCAYDLPSVKALVWYFHASAGFPVRTTWLKVIKAGNYDSWRGLTYENAEKYCPNTVETAKDYSVQTRQGVRSTKRKKRLWSSPPMVEIPNPASDLLPEIAPEDVVDNLPPLN